MPSVLRAAVFATLALAGAAAAVTAMNRNVPDPAAPEGPWRPGAALDGRVFRTVDTVVETGETLRDELHFADGRFQSAMCQEYCDFGWSEYRTWIAGDEIRFTATTRCPDAPHTVVWHGTAIGDEIRFEATWTTRRWYWTRQIDVVGEGTAAPSAAPEGSG